VSLFVATMSPRTSTLTDGFAPPMTSNADQRTLGGAPNPPRCSGSSMLFQPPSKYASSALWYAAGSLTLPLPSNVAPSRSPETKAGVHVAWSTSRNPSSAARAESSSIDVNGPLPRTVDWMSSTSNRLKKMSRRFGR